MRRRAHSEESSYFKDDAVFSKQLANGEVHERNPIAKKKLARTIHQSMNDFPEQKERLGFRKTFSRSFGTNSPRKSYLTQLRQPLALLSTRTRLVLAFFIGSRTQ